MTPLRMGIYGSVIGRVRYGEALAASPHLTVGGVADPHLRAAQGWARSLGGRIPAFETLAELLTLQPPLQAILLTAVPQERAAVFTTLLDAHLPVLCEVPLTNRLDEMDTLFASEARSPLVLPAFPRRFDPAFQEVRRQLQAERIGTLTQVRCAWSFPGSGALFAESGSDRWASDLLLYVLCQTADVCRLWLGEVQTVSADLDLLSAQTRADVAAERPHAVGLGNVLLTHAHGQATLHLLGKRTHQVEERYILTGTSGQLTLTLGTGGTTTTNTATQLTLHLPGEKPETLYADAVGPASAEESLITRIRPLLDHFVRCVQDQEPPEVTPADARAALEIAHAAYASALESAKVSLPLRRSPDISTLFQPRT